MYQIYGDHLEKARSREINHHYRDQCQESKDNFTKFISQNQRMRGNFKIANMYADNNL
jgi:hypothetical protein